MKRYSHSILLISVAFTLLNAAEKTVCASVDITAGVDYYSDYLIRGMYWYEKDGAFVPAVSFAKNGLAIGLSAEFSEDFVTGKDQSDPGVRKAEDFHTYGAGADYSINAFQYLNIGLSLWYYYFFNEKSFNMYTGTITLGLDFVCINPFISYTHDYFIKTGDARDYYIQVGVNKGMGHENVVLEFSIAAGYYNGESFSQRGMSDITGAIGFRITAGSVSYKSGFTYIYVPGREFYQNRSPSGTTTNDRHRTYVSFGASYVIN